MSPRLDELISPAAKAAGRGIASLCTAHPWVLKIALQGQAPLLIESTCNQVNQFGGYSGQTPAEFAAWLRTLAAENGFPPGQLILGGDHLGPIPWQNEPAASAMQKAADLVQACVQAGYTKIHLDCSPRLGDDPPGPPDVKLAAQRTAYLAGIAEAGACSEPGSQLRYVIGTEVPIPGGALEHEQGVPVTRLESARSTLEATRSAFARAGLQAAWERVIALVVQPGVEFGDDFVLEYAPRRASRLKGFIADLPLVYEAHSTDYQSPHSLRRLVRDHFAILKVGPALTFAFRQAVFALAHIENELLPAAERSRLVETLEQAMLRNPRHWQAHYRGSPAEQAFARKFSLSDRMRYYWPDPAVQAAFQRLLSNLGERPLPLALLSQYAPLALEEMRRLRLPNHPQAVIRQAVQSVLDEYRAACA